MNELNYINIKNLKGVGPKKEQLLNKLNIFTISDIIKHFPRYYEDFSRISKLYDRDDLGEKSLFRVNIISSPINRNIRKGLSLTNFLVADDSGECEVIFFNQPYLSKSLFIGKELYLYGSLERKYNRFQISSPQIINKNDIGGFNPIYKLTKGISNNEIKKYILTALDTYLKDIVDIVPTSINKKYNLPPLRQAIYMIHLPRNENDILVARKKLAFNELLVLQSSLNKINSEELALASPLMTLDNIKLIETFIGNLPFKLTGAQEKVCREIILDMSSRKNMNRLLQGDVGAGKTIVAAVAMLFASINNYQSAFMAPTEILAKQHYKSIKDLFKDYDIRVGLLTGDLTKAEKEEIYELLSSGSIDIIIGTHALIQKDVIFKNLGLTITDEQHRFGVQQRKDLVLKANNPHNLVMTATPIPRTLAMVLYGNMDISILDELPPGRKPIKTFVINDSYLTRLDNFILNEIKKGHQVFVVCPLIEEGDLEARSLEEIYDYYKSDKFKDIVVDIVHGRMNQLEKDKVMNDFLENKISMLISTTVIEVGINVPNANLMVIYDSDRFGLSQLHQLRGRVGRGNTEAFCILINNNTSKNSYERMKVMQQSNDGFYIAEKDLELRGQGDILGYRQHGLPNLLIADLFSDVKIIETIRDDYDIIIDEISENKRIYEEFKETINNMINKMSQ